ncbi:MAG: bifunctional 4-hydroxy-2-oxoglutarate aldolase/2-dehydro-3-deoxy-phosphogluconate aldolase [Clostridiales bacterium]|nr:bifunctional 4-hydroxy-2-oxoglutarate aldolase/2-dehydro-3-deoxy-phosphogluconate aldolase [Clostridiales bacterium]
MEKTMYGVLKTTGICPIMVAPELDFAADAAHALAEGGLPVCEVLLHRDENSLKRINEIAKNAPEVTVGAGSVISIRDAEEAIDAGAQFFVAPGFVPEVVEFALKKNMPILPGCVTASDISMALNCGINILKFFPVYQLGGADTLAQYHGGPFGNVEWVVTGGLNGKNFLPFSKIDYVLASGGDWMFAENNAVNDKNYEMIVENTRRTVLESLNAKAGK